MSVTSILYRPAKPTYCSSVEDKGYVATGTCVEHIQRPWLWLRNKLTMCGTPMHVHLSDNIDDDTEKSIGTGEKKVRGTWAYTGEHSADPELGSTL